MPGDLRDTANGPVPPGHRRPVLKLFPNPVAGTAHVIGLASSPLRGLHAGVVADRHRRRAETARQAHERALTCWSFDGERQMWIPDLLRQ